MARPRSSKTEEVKSRLVQRLQDGFFRPGDRFLSNRVISQKFGISYQTAHRLVQELCAEKYLERRPASGTFIPGKQSSISGAQLIFHPRAARAGSFGARLLKALCARLERDRMEFRVTFADGKLSFARELFPVIWECPPALNECVSQRRSALLLNERPPSGMQAVYIDSVSTDDFSGGVCAAELLLQRSAVRSGFAVLAGPADDERSKRRVEGFRSVLRASVVSADGWFVEDGYKVAGDVLRRGPRGIFCCNDRLAEALHVYCQRRKIACPPLIGFDDAPVAERLNLTTIAIPWDELVGGAVEVIKRRIAGDTSTSSHQIFSPRPVIRGL
ncbi:MAG TPA: substrate-binding domain-containing protein [Planctomycetota bacterium]|nr:substrate-binding domain-containing protein [Planctomycetota bacterium]